MKLARAHVFVLIALVAGCKGSSKNSPDSAPQGCEAGAKECRADGLYTCDAGGTFQLTEACASCDATPVPHCTVSCGDAGVASICMGDAVKDCASGKLVGCEAGTCLPAGKAAVCATKPGVSTCTGRRADGTSYSLACADANGVSTTQACDRRTGECVTAAYDCAKLASTAPGKVTCDAASGNYYSACEAGQPTALACGAGSTCAADGSTSCYTPPTAGATCGGPTVCFPGLHCTQGAPAGASCVQPAGQLACSSTDVLAVCSDTTSAFACVKGAVWHWTALDTWGGTCVNNHVTLAAGGVCIPGLADCQPGLECHRSVFDIAGVCRTPLPNAPAECVLTGQASTGRSCIYDWHSCADGHLYDVDCRIVNIGGNILTLCDCSVDGAKTKSFSGDAICKVTTIDMLDATAQAQCGWTVRTIDVTPN